MPHQISQPNIIHAAINGIQDAQNTYVSYSDGEWAWRGPEYLLCANIASRLFKLDGAKHITLESNVTKTLASADAAKRGAPKKSLRKNGRFDIVLWWGSGLPRAVIEVKNGVYSYSQIYMDVERISEALVSSRIRSSIQFGMVAFYISAKDNAKTKAEKQILSILKTLFNHTIDSIPRGAVVSLHHGTIHTVGTSAWVGACLMLKSAPNSSSKRTRKKPRAA